MPTSTDVRRAGLLERLARFAVHRRRLVLAGWAAVLVLVFILSRTAGGEFTNALEIPNTESQNALDLLKQRFAQLAGAEGQLVFQADGGVTSPEMQARIKAVIDEVGKLPGVVGAGSPFEPGGEGAVSPDGRVAYATVRFARSGFDLTRSDLEPLFRLTDGASRDGLVVEAGGEAVQDVENAPTTGPAEAIGLVAAAFILLVAFGSAVAMGLPVATALVGLTAGFMLLALGANVLNFPTFSAAFAAMIGIGVGIDYALFIVTRYREGLAAGLPVADAVALAMTTAGRAVAFAGTVVVIALLGIAAIGIPLLTALGVAGAVVVGLAVLVAFSLLPALLGFAGHAIDRWRLPLFHATASGDERSVWYRLARQIQRRPLPYFAGALALLVALTAPVLRVAFGFSDAGNNPTSYHSRRAYDLLAAGFGPGFNAPFMVVFDLRDTRDEQAAATLERVRQAVAAWPGVVAVSEPIPNPTGDAVIVSAIPAYGPQDERLPRLVRDLRGQVVAPAVAGTGVRAYVAGATAVLIDVTDRLVARMPVFIGAVLGLSFLLLVVVFRSVLVPLKAVIMNLLSIGAASGVVVAVFQWGWGAGLIGVKTGPIDVSVPLLLFSILFGLSMDYEVFLITRMREEYLRTGDNAASVARGLALTARVITAAAAIMVAVFLSFVLIPGRETKELGVGMATAVFVDATVVRLLLVPATMEMLGDANWWLPRWLDRLLPRLDVESAPRRPEPTAAR